MEGVAEFHAGGQFVEAVVGEGHEATARCEPGEDVIEDGSLERHRECSPRESADDDVKAFILAHVGIEVEVLSTGLFKAESGKGALQAGGEFGVQLDAEVFCPMWHGVCNSRS